jgi:hypothetical protein
LLSFLRSSQEKGNIPSSLLKQPPRPIGDLLVRIAVHDVSGFLLDEIESCITSRQHVFLSSSNPASSFNRSLEPEKDSFSFLGMKIQKEEGESMHTLITIILLPAIRPARDIIVVPTSKGTRIHALLLIGIIPASKRASVLALLIRVHASLLPLVGAVLGELLFGLVEEIHLCGLLGCVEEGRYGGFCHLGMVSLR